MQPDISPRALVVTAFCMKGIIALRVVALVSNVAFLVYGIGLGLVPVWLLHAILLPINGWRLWQAVSSARKVIAEHGNPSPPRKWEQVDRSSTSLTQWPAASGRRPHSAKSHNGAPFARCQVTSMPSRHMRRVCRAIGVASDEAIVIVGINVGAPALPTSDASIGGAGKVVVGLVGVAIMAWTVQTGPSPRSELGCRCFSILKSTCPSGQAMRFL